jgi:hypothetical protein
MSNISLTFFVTFVFVFFQNGPRSDLFGAFAVSATLFRTLLNMFVLPLFFAADSP